MSSHGILWLLPALQGFAGILLVAHDCPKLRLSSLSWNAAHPGPDSHCPTCLPLGYLCLCVSVGYLCLCGLPASCWATCVSVSYLCLCGLPASRWGTCLQVGYLRLGGLPASPWATCILVGYLRLGGLPAVMGECGGRTRKMGTGPGGWGQSSLAGMPSSL